MHRKGNEQFEASETIGTVGTLHYQLTTGEQETYKIKKPRILIGRVKKCDMILIGKAVSKFHAVIYEQDSSFFIKNISQTNGTVVNSKKVLIREIVDAEGVFQSNVVEPGSELTKDSPGEQLYNGDVISIGNFFISFTIKTEKIEEVAEAGEDEGMMYTLQEGMKVDSNETDFKKQELMTNVDEIRKDYEKLRVAYKFTQKGVVGQDLSTLIQNATDVIFSLFPQAENAIVLLVDEQTKALRAESIRENKNILRESINGPNRQNRSRVKFSTKLVNYVRDNRQAILSLDQLQDKRWAVTKSMATMGSRAAMAVPLIGPSSYNDKGSSLAQTNQGEVVGVLFLDSGNQNTFNKKELALLTSVSVPIGRMVSNHRLLQRILREERQQEALARFLPHKIMKQMMTKNQSSSGLNSKSSKSGNDDDGLGKSISAADAGFSRETAEVEQATVMFAMVHPSTPKTALILRKEGDLDTLLSE
ncbi:MAG: putative serine/threonine protein phosphatase [Streblomastix strix]|uniref:Putative serine/threonine protein phosphatase n=1 Tax=Streblomastix strix TaxID=222440 RepID=A0A5J4W438_9EUKA|nr:MAG: putative serine/threonine protein phosphatase [Streblomastix strix]